MQEGKGGKEDGSKRVLMAAWGLQRRGVNTEQVLLVGETHPPVSGSDFNTCKVTSAIIISNRWCLLEKWLTLNDPFLGIFFFNLQTGRLSYGSANLSPNICYNHRIFRDCTIILTVLQWVTCSRGITSAWVEGISQASLFAGSAPKYLYFIAILAINNSLAATFYALKN